MKTADVHWSQISAWTLFPGGHLPSCWLEAQGSQVSSLWPGAAMSVYPNETEIFLFPMHGLEIKSPGCTTPNDTTSRYYLVPLCRTWHIPTLETYNECYFTSIPVKLSRALLWVWITFFLKIPNFFSSSALRRNVFTYLFPLKTMWRSLYSGVLLGRWTSASSTLKVKLWSSRKGHATVRFPPSSLHSDKTPAAKQDKWEVSPRPLNRSLENLEGTLQKDGCFFRLDDTHEQSSACLQLPLTTVI